MAGAIILIPLRPRESSKFTLGSRDSTRHVTLIILESISQPVLLSIAQGSMMLTNNSVAHGFRIRICLVTGHVNGDNAQAFRRFPVTPLANARQFVFTDAQLTDRSVQRGAPALSLSACACVAPTIRALRPGTASASHSHRIGLTSKKSNQ